MSSIINSLYELKYNPFKHSQYITSFYTSILESENNLLLAQLIIPLCSHPIFGEKLSNSNVRSTIWSIFDDRAMCYDLQERVDCFQDLTRLSIEYCLINDWLSIDKEHFILRSVINSNTIITKQKNAEKLGRLLSGHSVIEIYAFLGVKPR